jgi:hypothetical protein
MKMQRRATTETKRTIYLPTQEEYANMHAVALTGAYEEEVTESAPAFAPTAFQPSPVYQQPLTDLEIIKANITFLLDNIDFIDQIEDISKNPFLLQYYEVALNITERHKGGLFILDTKGVYTPIQTDLFGIVHLVRLPHRPQNVYALTDFRKSILFTPTDDRYFIFQGVEKLAKDGYGYRFESDDYEIAPVSGVTPVRSAELRFTYEAPKHEELEGEEEIPDDQYRLES